MIDFCKYCQLKYSQFKIKVKVRLRPCAIFSSCSQKRICRLCRVSFKGHYGEYTSPAYVNMFNVTHYYISFISFLWNIPVVCEHDWFGDTYSLMFLLLDKTSRCIVQWLKHGHDLIYLCWMVMNWFSCDQFEQKRSMNFRVSKYDQKSSFKGQK